MTDCMLMVTPEAMLGGKVVEAAMYAVLCCLRNGAKICLLRSVGALQIGVKK
jgi:hypothetical protein